MNTKIKIGTCAWSFDDWQGVFYPPHLPHAHWLDYYARHFPVVEIDSTFYHIPGDHAARHWMQQTPDNFCFTIKMPRAITHEARLRDCGAKLDYFLESLNPLRPKLGCVLIQLPAAFVPRHDESALRHFVASLPADIPFAIEFRHGDWHLPRIGHLLEEHGLCWVWNDTSPLEKQASAAFEFLPQTADFLYVRLLGNTSDRYRADGSRIHCYDRLQWPRDSSLESWAIKIKNHLEASKHIYRFANNHFEGFSPLTCQRIARQFDLEIRLPAPEPPKVAAEPASSQLNLL
ncbi:MAG: DUF72 domain-containing protein [Verrucomicrobiota bacterium]